MNKSAIFHKSKSNYAYAFDKNTLNFTIRVGKDVTSVYLYTSNDIPWIVDENGIWNWSKKKVLMEKKYETELYDYYFISYFTLDSGCRYGFIINDEILYTERGFFDIDDPNIKNDINSYFAFPYISEIDVFSPPKWVENTNWYQIFVDRFSNGNKLINQSNVKKWDLLNGHSHDFYGGDLIGIYNKLEYLKNLGINGIYLTPIFKSLSTHKYDTTDYYEIDPHFGSIEDLKKLIKKAHSLNIKIMLDGVFNHIGSDSFQFLDVLKNQEKSIYKDWFYIDFPLIDESNYKNFSKTMPKLNVDNLEVRKYIYEIVKYYIEEFDIDGWRLDVANEVSHDFLRGLRTVAKETKEDVYILGETWNDASIWLNGDQFDGSMNYPLSKPILEFIGNSHTSKEFFKQSFVDALVRYSKNVNKGMMNLLDSHDTGRISSIALNEKRVILCFLMLYILPGSTCIFYGSEIGLKGRDENYGRLCMNFDNNENHLIYQNIQLFLKIRNKFEAMKSNDFIFHEISNDHLIIEKTSKSKNIILIFNLNNVEIEIPNSLKSLKVKNLKNEKEFILNNKINEDYLILEIL